MVYKGYIAVEIRASVFQLHQKTEMTLRQIARSCGISPSSTVRILKQGIQRYSQVADRAGRPRKITAKQERLLIRNL